MATITQKQFIQALLAEVQYNRDKLQALEKTQVLVDVDLFYSKIGSDARFQYKADMVDYDTKEEINSRFSNYYTQIQIDQKLGVITTSSSGSVDLDNYFTKDETYNRRDVDLRVSTITANYLSATEINNDFLNKNTADLNEVMGNIAVPRVILTETPVANSNQAARMEDVQRAVEGIGNGNFVETNYFSDNAKLLTRNDKVSTETAKIGEEYKGDIEIGARATGSFYIGEQATGTIRIGAEATRDIFIGDQVRGRLHLGPAAKGNIRIGQGAQGTIELGRRVLGTLSIGEQAEGIQQYGFQAKNTITVGRQASGAIEIGQSGTGSINIGQGATKLITIGKQATEIISIGDGSTGPLSIGSRKWNTPEAPFINGFLRSGNTNSTFREIIDKANEQVDSFVATGNTGAPLGTINDSTSQFFNGGTITTGNTVKLDFINANYTFTENIRPGFILIRNDTKKLDIGQSNKRVFIKVGVIINSFSGASVGQLEIALKSGNIDIGTDSIVLINPNPNAFFVKTIGVLNSDLVKQEGISISITSQNGNFVIGGLEVILL